MPKDKSSRSFSNKSHDFFYKPYSRGKSDGSSSKEEDPAEWEDVTCPICMESPHNAVLLLCSSYDKGCRPYMCDTSYRHSNCLDQYMKAHSKSQASSSEPVQAEHLSPGSSRVRTREMSELIERSIPERRDFLSLGIGTVREETVEEQQERAIEHVSSRGGNSAAAAVTDDGAVGRWLRSYKGLNLACPLCRGKVGGWKVVEQARRHLNCKDRGCAHDSCSFAGSYEDLRKHARFVHPFARPSEVDPARERDWWRMERQRDLGDVLSSIQSAMPGATIIGDYVIEEDGEDREDGGADETELAGEDRNWWTMLLLFQVLGPAASSHAGSRGYPSILRGYRGGAALPIPTRQALWGENMDEASGGGVGSSHSGSHSGNLERGAGSARRRRRSRR